MQTSHLGFCVPMRRQQHRSASQFKTSHVMAAAATLAGKRGSSRAARRYAARRQTSTRRRARPPSTSASNPVRAGSSDFGQVAANDVLDHHDVGIDLHVKGLDPNSIDLGHVDVCGGGW